MWVILFSGNLSQQRHGNRIESNRKADYQHKFSNNKIKIIEENSSFVALTKIQQISK